MTEPVMFAIPAGPAVQLDVAPRLASWNRAGDPDQMKLEAFLAATEQLLRPRCEQLTGPLALRLDIGLPPTTPLLDQRDLDNYLFPLAVRMSKTTGTRLVSVWGTKQHSAASFARIEPAVPIQAPTPGGPRYNLWKPTIDALGQILGSTSPGRSWHPQDGRIVVLGLHCRVDHALGNEVLITIEANTHQI